MINAFLGGRIMKKIGVYLLAIALIFAMLFGITSCKKGDTPPEDDNDQTSESVVIASADGCDYAIVFGEAAPLGGKWANAFSTQLYSKFSIEKKPFGDSTPKAGKEILIGQTSRALSTELKVAATSGKDESGWLWGIGYKEDSLAVYANCQSAYDIALSVLFTEYMKDGALSVESDLWVLGEKTKAEVDAEAKAEEEAKILAERNERLAAAKKANEAFKLADFDNTDPSFKYTWASNKDYSWVGTPENIATTQYSDPPVSPTTSQHPRVMLNKDIVAKLKAFLERDDLDASTKRVINDFWSQADTVADGIFPDKTGKSGNVYRYDVTEINAINAKALAYLITGHEAYAYEAIVGAKNMIRSIEYTKDVHMDPYHGYGHLAIVASLVYDWCYDVLTESDKQMFINGVHNYLLCNLEFHYPPENMNSVNSHATGPQFLRHYMTVAIAFADERPDWWDFIGGRFYAEYVPMCDLLFEGGYVSQGTASYAPGKYFNYLWASWLLKCSTGTTGFDEQNLRSSGDGILGMIMPDGTYYATGDRTAGKKGITVDAHWMFLAAAMFDDPVALANAKYYSNDYTIYNLTDLRTTTPALLLIYFSSMSADASDDVDTKGELVSFIKYPGNQMTVRNSFTADAASAFMRIGGLHTGSHDSDDAGTFQLYYKGLLACTSGVYNTYGATHHQYYMQTTVSHNGLLIYNPDFKNTDNGWYSGGQIAITDTATFDDWTNGNNVVGELLGYDYSSSKSSVDYAYIAGDITKAYHTKTVDYVGRRMLTVYTDDEKYPMIFFVFDSIDSDSADFRKTFLLHTVNEPTINEADRSAVIVNGEGKAIFKNTVGGDKIQKIGGEGFAYWIGNGNDFDGTEASGKNCVDEYVTEDRHDTIWGRLEVSAGGEERTDMLSVMYVTDADNNDTLEISSFENDTIALTTVGDVTAVFIKSINRNEKSLSFIAEGSGENMEYYVSGMLEGTWKVSVNGEDRGSYKVKEESGLLRFTAPAGEVTLIPGDDIASTSQGKILYDTGRGVLTPGAPTTYQYGVTTPITATAEHPKDIFAGWYFDYSYTQPATVIPADSTGAVRLYAKWNMTFIDEDYTDSKVNTSSELKTVNTIKYWSNNTGSSFVTMTENGESFLRWTYANDTNNTASIQTETVTGKTFADMTMSDAVVSVQIDVKNPENKDLLGFKFRFNTPGAAYGRLPLFRITNDGVIHFGAETTGETVGNVSKDGSITSIRLVVDFVNAKIYFYNTEGEKTSTFDIVVPTEALTKDDTLTPGSANEWRAKYLNGYYFYFEEVSGAADVGKAVDICTVKLVQGNIFE